MSSFNIDNFLEHIMEKAKNDPEIIGVILFGSYLRGNSFSDVDIVLVGKNELTKDTMYQKRINYMKKLPMKFDVQIFQLLPLRLRKEVLSGKVLYDTCELYDLAYETIKKYDHFKKYLEDYVRGVLIES
ncbi:MAG: nucleotidyltransferase domain-containing protein [Candidatus Hodarchaeota archaeon]